MPIISIIAAMDNNRLIGSDNQLPWYLPADLKYFKKVTTGKPILMGRKTYESIGKPLPGRINIIVTKNKQYSAPGCEVAHSIEHALCIAENHPEIMIIGGASFYQHMLPKAQRLYLTQIQGNNFTGDAYFPEWNESEWYEVGRENHQPDEKNKYVYSFIILEKREN
ncbi:Dihydrofolate reductase [hydrothermal vent metagenome]|uniref:dihydrofolate reductase n=1 Tax=hydrothermal vent metagenome TaxID=652676 RepID=A0A3B0YZK5_9ZZZZ